MKCPSCGADNLEGADECDGCRTPLTEAPAPPAGGLEKRILGATIADLGPKPAKTIPAAATILQAVEAMRQGKIGCLLALEGAALAGIVSERELALGLPEGGDLSRARVKDFLREEPDVLSDQDALADAFHRMALSGHWHLPVRLRAGGYGVVSARDLLRYLCL